MNVNENKQIAEAQADGEAADDQRWMAMATDPDRPPCGCDFPHGGEDSCGCKPEAFTATRAELRRLSKGDLFVLYTRCLNDEMPPTTWRGLTKADILEVFLDGGDSVELTPLI
jgi:hypothetical protein